MKIGGRSMKTEPRKQYKIKNRIKLREKEKEKKRY